MQAVSGKSMNTDKILQLIHVYSFSPSPPVSQISFFLLQSQFPYQRFSNFIYSCTTSLRLHSLISLSQQPEIILGGLILQTCQ